MGMDKHKSSNGAKFKWSVTPSEVDDDGYWGFDGVRDSMVGVELRPTPPNDDESLQEIAVRKAKEVWDICPCCGSSIDRERPIFSVGTFIVYPCSVTDEWVWADMSNSFSEGAA